MDSLYEAVQESCQAQVYTIPSRSCSPAVLSDDATKWRSAGRSISMVTIEMTAECIYCTVMGNVSAIWTHAITLLWTWWASIKWKLLLIDCAVTIWKYIKVYLRPAYERETWNDRPAKSWEHISQFQINIYNNTWVCMLKFLDKMIKLPHDVFVYRKVHNSTLEKRNKGESNLCC